MKIQYLGAQAKVNIPVINEETRPLTFTVNGMKITIPRGEDILIDAKYAEVIERYWNARHYETPTEEQLRAQDREQIGAVGVTEVEEILEQKGGIYTLWTGWQIDGTIEFNVAEKYFQKNKKHLTLLLEFAEPHTTDEVQGTNCELVSIGIEEDQTDGFLSYFEIRENVNTVGQGGFVKVTVTRVTDIRYATCKIEFNANGRMKLTNVSAIVPQEV